MSEADDIRRHEAERWFAIVAEDIDVARASAGLEHSIRQGRSGIAVLRAVPNPKNNDTIWSHVINDDIRMDYYEFSCAIMATSSALREFGKA